MAKPYSYDFRQKVVAAIKVDGRKKCEVSEVFNISRNTIGLWLTRKKQTGDFLPEPNRPPGSNHKITVRLGADCITIGLLAILNSWQLAGSPFRHLFYTFPRA